MVGHRSKRNTKRITPSNHPDSKTSFEEAAASSSDHPVASRSPRKRLKRAAFSVGAAVLALAAAVLLGWISFPGARILAGTLLLLGDLAIIYAYFKGLLH